MNNTPQQRHFLIRFFNEVALYSGQYAFFFLAMHFSSDGSNFWFDAGHDALLLALIIQTTALVYYGHKIVPRIMLSFLSLVVYTLFELREGGFCYSLVNTGHLCFWIYTLIFAALQYISYTTKRQNIRMLMEFVESNINMFVFILIYLLLDLRLELLQEVAAGKISAAFADEQLLIWNFHKDFRELIKDPAHVYIIIGSGFLSFTIAYGRIRILLLYCGPLSQDKKVRGLRW